MAGGGTIAAVVGVMVVAAADLLLAKAVRRAMLCLSQLQKLPLTHDTPPSSMHYAESVEIGCRRPLSANTHQFAAKTTLKAS